MNWRLPEYVPIRGTHRGFRIHRARLREIVAACLEAEKAPPGAVLGVLLCGDRQMRRLNREFRGKDRTTDVLSFSDTDSDSDSVDAAPPIPDGEPPMLGEIAISLPQCARQADEQGVPYGRELLRLVVHGVLHVLGYDHIEAADRARMEPRERDLRLRCRRRGFEVELMERRES